MKDAKVEAESAQIRLRALAVSAGLLTEEQAEKWIVVRVGEMGKGPFKNIDLPSVCEGCGADHSNEEWTPLLVGISPEVPKGTREALFMMLQQGSASVN
jgi:hypothetical protein